ncbi:MAG TPA: response regulator transcription factor [Nitrospiria bacterium]|nr:response regulator transcription factor [Nitrospiria bacterium]
MSRAEPTVFIVDDEPAVLTAVSRLFRSAGMRVATFTSPTEFLNHYDPAAPGCLVLDVAMPGLNGLELQQALTAGGAGLPIIFLTGRADIPMSVQAMKRGAVDFLCKPVDDATLFTAVRAAIEQDHINRRAQAERADIQRRLATLTPREREVLAHVVSGQPNKQIAGDLGTVEKTIKVHRARVMEKMNARSLAELVTLAQRAGMTTALRRLDRPAPIRTDRPPSHPTS